MNASEIMLAEHAVSKTVIGYMNAVGSGRWNDVAQYFDDLVRVDYSDVHPGPVETLRREDLVMRWKVRFDKEIAYQHEISNLEVCVSGSDAICYGNNIGSHVMEDASGKVVFWQVGVRLEWKLKLNGESRWVIAAVTAEYIWDRTEPFHGRKLPSRKKT